MVSLGFLPLSELKMQLLSILAAGLFLPAPKVTFLVKWEVSEYLMQSAADV